VFCARKRFLGRFFGRSLSTARRWRRALAEPFPEEWRRLLAARVANWRLLEQSEQARLEDLIRLFLACTLWEGAAGLTVTDEMRVTIAAEACLLVLGLGPGHYDDVTAVIVHPRTAVRRGERALHGGVVTDTEIGLRGEARTHGPVLLVWEDVRADARHRSSGRNVVHHEFAHKLDMADGYVDGEPGALPRDQRNRFRMVCDREFRRLQEGTDDGVLDPYGATNPAEFFAAATEAFFGLPEELETATPDLYAVLRDFYRQDPAERRRRFTAREP
jgi:hypothetical protein